MAAGFTRSTAGGGGESAATSGLVALLGFGFSGVDVSVGFSGVMGAGASGGLAAIWGLGFWPSPPSPGGARDLEG